VWPHLFLEGDLVLAIRCSIIMSKHMGNKFLSKWDDPYVVQEVYTNRAYKIIDKNGLRIGPSTANSWKDTMLDIWCYSWPYELKLWKAKKKKKKKKMNYIMTWSFIHKSTKATWNLFQVQSHTHKKPLW